MPAFKDLTNKKFGTRTVIRRVDNQGVDNDRPAWLVRCNCGYESTVRADTLIEGKADRCYSCSGKTNRLGKGIAGLHELIDSYKRGAKDREYAWGLTDEEVVLITSSFCRFCGIEPAQKIWRRNKACTEESREWSVYIYNGIDRWDNKLGYTFDNCVPCCKRCNRAKDTMSGEEYIAHINKQHAHLHQ